MRVAIRPAFAVCAEATGDAVCAEATGVDLFLHEYYNKHMEVKIQQKLFNPPANKLPIIINRSYHPNQT